jgi:hypothetical protein
MHVPRLLQLARRSLHPALNDGCLLNQQSKEKWTRSQTYIMHYKKINKIKRAQDK